MRPRAPQAAFMLALRVVALIPAALAAGILLVGQKHSPERHAAGVARLCVYRQAGALPDPVCTPGAVNHAVTQATIRRTICKPGWAASVRPPVAVTEPQKFQAMRAYGDSTAPGQAARYEFDHLIPIELGGAVDDRRNLWPELHHVTGSGDDQGSVTKDKAENALRADVCAGRMKLRQARRIIRTDWLTIL